jgi:phospholipase C
MMTAKHLASLAVLSLAACSSVANPQSVFGPALRSAPRPATKGPIEHVIFVIQENRSFNNLFMGYPNATTAKYGYDQEGDKIKLKPRALNADFDVGHDSSAFFGACDGTGKIPGTDCRMDGWIHEGAAGKIPSNPAYSYVPRKEITSYWTMAKQYVLADQMFSSNFDGSFIAHQYSVAAYADHAFDYPKGAWGCEGGGGDTVPTIENKRVPGPSIVPCFPIPTIASEADAAQLSWRFYAGAIGGDGGLWSSYQADKKIYDGPDWNKDVINPPSQFLTDVAAGTLASITWITPTTANSDHPEIHMDPMTGPSWVTSIVDAVGESKFWDSTAIFIMWDDWGGFFDPVPPPYEDYDGLGFRVPLIVVSPYAKQGYVTHVQYETASVLRYIEDDFGLAPLARADSRANDPASDVFDYGQKPRRFKMIVGSKPASYWIELERRAGSLPTRPSLAGGD